VHLAGLGETMTYLFSGVLSNDSPVEPLPSDSSEIVYRSIEHPNLKSGVLFPQQAEEQIETPNQKTEELVGVASSLGISNGIWVYYMCWGGDVESIAVAKLKNSKIDMDTYRMYEDVTYNDLHGIFLNYGISIEKNGRFEPFVRNFWGDYGY
jgi:hypothetical protein